MSTLYKLTEAYQELLSMALDPDTDPEALAKLLLDSEEEQRKLRHKVVALEWLLEQNEYFARIGRAVTKWRGQHGQNKTGT